MSGGERKQASAHSLREPGPGTTISVGPGPSLPYPTPAGPEKGVRGGVQLASSLRHAVGRGLLHTLGEVKWTTDFR